LSNGITTSKGFIVAEKNGKFWSALEWFSRIHAVHVIVHSEFVKTWLLPLMSASITGLSGYYQNSPLMWICLATAGTFMMITITLLASTAYKQFHDPANKLLYNATIFNFDLDSISHNRKARRANPIRQQGNATIYLRPPERTLLRGQLGIQVVNSANFPISIILEAAETEIEGNTPPRHKYPRPAVTALPGIPITVCDLPIPLNGRRCDTLQGKLYMTIRYGLPGKENYKLEIRARRVDIMLSPNGFLSGVNTSWEDAIDAAAD